MVRRFRWGLSAVAITLAACALAACGGGSGERTSATLGTAVTTTTTDPYAVPAVIDEAYVNRVLAGLDAAVGDVVRLVVREKAVTPEAMDRLKSLYAGSALDQQVEGFRSATGFSNFRSPPGNRKTQVVHLATVRGDCLFAEVTRDFSPVVLTRPTIAGQRNWVALRKAANSALGGNPTGWVADFDEVGGPDQPPDPCEQ